MWTFPEPVSDVRIRLNEGEWIDWSGATAEFKPDAPLSEGLHHFEVQGRNTDTEWSESMFETQIEYVDVNDGYWFGVSRPFTNLRLVTPWGLCVTTATARLL